MATRCCSARCSAERKGFRRELDSWRHKLIHCVGFESILEGIYGPRLLHDLSIFVNCEPEATGDWSTDACCSFCNLQLDKNSDRLPDSPPHAETPPQGINTSDTLQCQADQFLHAVLHKKEFPESFDSIIPLAAQELMRKMIRQFAVEYAHKIQTTENQNAITQTEPDGPLDLTLSRNTQCTQQDGVLDLSKKNTPSLNTLAQQRLSGRPIRDERLGRSTQFADGLLSKAVKDVRSGALDLHKAAILYGIPQNTLRLHADHTHSGAAPLALANHNGVPSSRTSLHTGETKTPTSWTRPRSEQSERGKPSAESAAAASLLHRLVCELRDRGDACNTPAGGSALLRIPQVRPGVTTPPSDLSGLVDAIYLNSKTSDRVKILLPKHSDCSATLESRPLQGDVPPPCVCARSVGGSASADECLEESERRDKQPRKKRGRYRQYDHDILEEAIAMVMGGKMTVSKAQSVYGVPHSTLEYKVKERLGTLKTPPKKKIRPPEPGTSGTTLNASKRCLETKEEENMSKEKEEEQKRTGTALEEVMTSLCTHHRDLLLHILQEMKSFLPEDECGMTAAQRGACRTVGNLKNEHGGHCCQADESLCVLSSCVATGCVCSCRLGVCAVRSVCLCVNCCSGLSSQSITLGCCARSQIMVCQHTHSGDITHVAHSGSVAHPRCHSPSPPPLSPKPQDTGSVCDTDMPTLNTHTPNTQPPPLLPHNTHTDQTLMPEMHAKPEHFINLVDKFTDTLMEASEREWSVHTHMGDSVKACDDTHLTEIITTVLHSSSEKDYNLKELFEQHLASEKRSPQTRLQRRQEVMQAISRSRDQAATRRQSLQIKRDLARLEPDISRKKKRKMHLINHGTHNQVPGTSISRAQNPDTPISCTLNPDTPISCTLNPDTPISCTLNPDMPISHTLNSDTPISHTQNLDTPISHTQSPDTLIPNTQNLDTCISHALNQDTSILPAQSPDTAISHTPSPTMPISNAQSPNTPISHTQNTDTLISNAQSPGTPILHAESLETPISHAPSSDTPILNGQSLNMPSSNNQTPDIPMSHAQCPDMPISHTQTLDTPISDLQSPDTPLSQVQNPDKPISHVQNPDMPISLDQSPGKPISHTQTPDTPISALQSPDTPISQVQSPDTQILQNQRPGTLISHLQSPDTPISDLQSPDTPISQIQSPGTPILQAQTLGTPNLHTQSPDIPGLHTQSSNSPSSDSQSPESEACGNVRSRRHIVRPQHLSSYVTEPRKMFYTACRSAKNNSTSAHGTDTIEPSPNAVIEQLQIQPVLPKERKVCKDENSAQPNAENRLGVKTRYSEEVTRSPSPVVTDCTDTDNLKYASPIKLMLVSTTKDDDGVKYTLRAAQTHSDEESFDPFVEASWSRKTIKEKAKDETVHTVGNNCTEKLSTQESTNTEALGSDCVNGINEAEPTIRRRPGRPKKLKSPPEKAVKRPIGRPRKSKPVDTNAVPSEDAEKQKAEDSSSGEAGNKNLKITITYGRRKTRRMVSEGQVPTEQSTDSGDSTQISNVEEPAESTQAQVSMNKDQFCLVMPVEDRKNLTHSIMCPKQSDEAGARRPGRPAKVKISGISVTVTTVSPRQRKIHMKRNVKEPAIRRRALLTELEPNEKQETITEEGQASVRHSARERRPSIHLLRCVAMSRSNTPTPRSRKLLLHKAEKTQQETQQHEDAQDYTARPNTSSQDAVHFSAASGESLFDANLQWWPTSASPETLKEEMNRRLKVMKETWVSDTSEEATSDEDRSSALSSSAVRILFERDCSMETLCSWFMQTTETQSLAIVKKANNQNPCEVFQYSSSQASNRSNVSWSPQAERLRKCIKKFATVVPKSPMKLRQAQVKFSNMQKCFTKQQVFNATPNNAEKSQQCGAWHLYRAALDRARSRFKCRTKNTDVEYKSLNVQEQSEIQSVSVSDHGLVKTLKSESRRTSTQQKQITANAWSAHTLRECKVFLRKLNSANTRSMSEESNDCTVRFSISPAGGGSVPHREQGVKKGIKLKRTSNSGACTRLQSKVNRKRRQSCTNVSPPSPKRQRSSRGVMAAKWSDFILGPAR